MSPMWLPVSKAAGVLHERVTVICFALGTAIKSHIQTQTTNKSHINITYANRGFHQAGPSHASPRSNSRKNRGPNPTANRPRFKATALTFAGISREGPIRRAVLASCPTCPLGAVAIALISNAVVFGITSGPLSPPASPRSLDPHSSPRGPIRASAATGDAAHPVPQPSRHRESENHAPPVLRRPLRPATDSPPRADSPPGSTQASRATSAQHSLRTGIAPAQLVLRSPPPAPLATTPRGATPIPAYRGLEDQTLPGNAAGFPFLHRTPDTRRGSSAGTCRAALPATDMSLQIQWGFAWQIQ